jgi:hypothetical protein
MRKTKRSIDKQQCLFTEPLLETQEIAAANCGRTKPPKKSYISWNWNTAVSRRQLRVRSGGSARIGYAALVLRSTLEVDRALPSAVLSTHRSR